MDTGTRIKRIFRAIKSPRLVLYVVVFKYLNGFLKDETYLKLVLRLYAGEKLELKNPQTFNQKLQWLKLYAHRPEYVTMADKYAAKKYVADIIGEEYVVPCLGAWEKAEDIDFSKLPNQFVLKCTHNSCNIGCVCKDKGHSDLEKMRKEIAKGLKEDYFKRGRDKQYRDIPKKIIADKYLDDGTGKELRDYKWWCFDGKPTYMYYTNKGEDIYENFFDMDYNPVPIDHGFKRHKPEMEKPAEFELMKELAAKLSKGIPFVRIDFFDVNHHVYFSEFTFFDWGGFRPFGGNWNYELGKLIKIPEQKSEYV